MRVALAGRLGPDLNGTELREQLRELVYDSPLGRPATPARAAPEPADEPEAGGGGPPDGRARAEPRAERRPETRKERT